MRKAEILKALKKMIKEGLEPSRKWRAWNFARSQLKLEKEVVKKLKTGERYAYEEEKSWEKGGTVKRWIDEKGRVYERVYKKVIKEVPVLRDSYSIWRGATTYVEEVEIEERYYKIEEELKGKKFYYLPEEVPEAPSLLPHIRVYSGIKKMPDFDLKKLTIEFTNKLKIVFKFNLNSGFIYEIKMADADEWEGADWEDLPKDYRVEIEKAEELGQEVVQMLNSFKVPDIEEITKRKKEEMELELEVDEEVYCLAVELIHEKLTHAREEINKKVKEEIIGDRITADIKSSGKILVKRGTKITEETVDKIIKFIKINPDLLAHKANRVREILTEAEKKREELIRKKVKELMNGELELHINRKRKEIKITKEEFLEKHKDVLDWIGEKGEEIKRKVEKWASFWRNQKIPNVEMFREELKKIEDKVREAEEEKRREEKEREELEKKAKKIINNEIPLLSWDGGEIYLSDINESGEVEVPENLVGAFIGKGGRGVKLAKWLLHKKGARVKRINIKKKPASTNAKFVKKHKDLEDAVEVGILK